MLGSDTLDVAIGIIFLFLMLSLICSAINELIEVALKNRAKDLDRGICELLSDPNALTIVPKLYAHPLISGLYKGTFDTKNLGELPSYIPSRTFTLALLDVLRPANASTPSGASGAVYSRAPATEGADRMPSVDTLEELRNALAAQQIPAARALVALIDAAGTDAAVARQNVEDWFNSAMDRVSGWYKRRTQFTIFWIGIVVALVVNADAIAFTQYLSTNKEARAIIVSQAQAVQKVVAASPARASAAPSSSASSTPSTNESVAKPTVDPLKPAPTELVDTLGWLQRETGLPFGWRFWPKASDDAATVAEFKTDWRRAPRDAPEALVKLVSIVLTACAVSFGAPFWFDLLNKFMIVRSTVKPAEKSPNEGSKS